VVEPSANWDSIRSPTSGNHNLSAPFSPSKHHHPVDFCTLAFLLFFYPLFVSVFFAHLNERAVPSFPSLLTFGLLLLRFPCLPSIVILSWRHCSPASVTHRPSRSPAWHPQHPGTGLQGLTNTHRTTHNSVSGCKRTLTFLRTTASRRFFLFPESPNRTPASFDATRCIHLQDNKRLAALRESSHGRNAPKEDAGWFYWRSRKHSLRRPAEGPTKPS
jgi:hypothetical protein